MTIQFNTDHNISGREAVIAPFTAMIAEDLKRFSEHITRVEVHLTDENGRKEGIHDKRCLIEAKIEGMQPIAVSHHANANEQAVRGALTKLHSSLATIFDRMKTH